MKRQSTSQWISILLILIFTLSSCSSVPKTPTPLPMKLRFAFLGQDANYQGLADQFHSAHPSITIELAPLSTQGGGFQSLADQFSKADVLRANVNFLGQDQIAAVSALDVYITADKNFQVNDFFPGSLQALQYQGKQLGIPAGLDPYVMFYENMRFRIAGVTPLTSDYTLGQFLAAAKAVNLQDQSVKNKGQFSYGFCTHPQNNDPLIFAYLFGGGLTEGSPDVMRPVLNSPANVEAVKWYTSLWTEYAVTPPITDNPYAVFQYVNAATCGFWIQTFDMYGFLNTSSSEPRMLPLPRINATFNMAALDGYFIPKTAPHPQEAWQWLSFLVNRQEAAMGQVPPLKKLIASDAYAQRVSPDALAIARGLKSDETFIGFPQLFDSRQGQYVSLFGDAVRQVVEGQADVQSALDAAQKKAEALAP